MKNVKLQKILSTISLIGIFVIAGIITLALTKMFKFTKFTLNLVIFIAILCVGCIMVIPGAKRVDKDKKDWIGWTVVGLSGLTVILWFVLQIVGNNIITAIVNNNVTSTVFAGRLWIIKITALLTVLTLLVSISINLFDQLGKNMLSLQIMIASGDFVIFIYLAILIFSFKVTDTKAYLSVNPFTNKLSLSIFVIALLFSAISSGIIKGRQKRALRGKAIKGSENQNVASVSQQNQDDSVEKLKNLKQLLDTGVLTQEEYDQKRKEIVDKL